MPPFTSITAPVIKLTAREHRKATGQPISSSSPKHPIGIALASNGWLADFNSGVSIGPGAIAFTTTLVAANCRAK